MRRHVMRDVHNRDVGINFQDDALHRTNEMIVGAVVGRQSNDGIRRHRVPPLEGFLIRAAGQPPMLWKLTERLASHIWPFSDAIERLWRRQ